MVFIGLSVGWSCAEQIAPDEFGKLAIEDRIRIPHFIVGAMVLVVQASD